MFKQDKSRERCLACEIAHRLGLDCSGNALVESVHGPGCDLLTEYTRKLLAAPPASGALGPVKGTQGPPCAGCGKTSRITTAGCDHCDYEDKQMSDAKEISQAVLNVQGHLFEHRQFMEQWMQRFEAASAPVSTVHATPTFPPFTDEQSSCGGCGERSAPWEGWQRPDAGQCWWLWDVADQTWLFACRRDETAIAPPGSSPPSSGAAGAGEAACKWRLPCNERGCQMTCARDIGDWHPMDGCLCAYHLRCRPTSTSTVAPAEPGPGGAK